MQLRFDAANATGLPERVRAADDQLAGQRATKDGVIVIEARRFRTQEQNRADARARLIALVAKAAEPPPKPRRKKDRPTGLDRTPAQDKGRPFDGQEAARQGRTGIRGGGAVDSLFKRFR